MTIKLRFAPSPTGRIHVGNTRIALMNWLLKLQNDGIFVLRFDDTDVERSKQEYIDAIEEDLAWLGIVPDERVKQSDRFAKYDAATQKLKESGRLYPCYETPDELDRRRKRQLARGLPPVYDRKALELTQEDKAKLEAEGRRPHWRFKLEPKTVSWPDLVRGAQGIESTSLSDPILVREDGSYLYTLPSCVDDIEMGITHVVRGEDHVANTGAQIQVFEALGGTPPQFAHTNLLVSATGEGLSKRLGSLSVGQMRQEGLEAMTVATHAVLIGTSEAIRPIGDYATLADTFSFDKVSRAPARFDPEELKTLNAKLLHELDFAKVEDRLKALDANIDEDFWNIVRGNINVWHDAKDWYDVVAQDITPLIDEEDRQFITLAKETLPEGELMADSWGIWTRALKAETGRKGRGLFMPLRKALTGRDHGPDMSQMLALIGRERALVRLS